MTIEDLDDHLRFYLGPARNADLLEIVSVVRDDGPELAIHAMNLRPTYRRASSRGVRMGRKSYGKTASGKPITDDLVTELSEKAEAGFDTDEIVRRRGGRPPMGAAAATVESVRLDPELREALTERARRDRETTSSVIRKALRKYLDVA